ncbi:hypothetical protein [Mycolicibacterium agri]|uniref:Uncharacterized protein n=1 Tax=Mycolicibacterium agri TaxID=36811 RepID=A0A7I9VVK1_MYCAG|nr:hypothetical protein [Mycolicibacterium agri]GFG49340.1 hypothetical protein MAGR_07810 [Mycolicibacterium agri]
MESVAVTPSLTMLRVDGWQFYAWRDDDSMTLIDTGAPGHGAAIRGEAELAPPVFEDWEIPIFQRVAAELPRPLPLCLSTIVSGAADQIRAVDDTLT